MGIYINEYVSRETKEKVYQDIENPPIFRRVRI